MANIAVICEGVSEFNILNHIVSRYTENNFLNPIQPKINSLKETQANDGGWSRVLDHCTDEDLEKIFMMNDYLIIQIDTDSSHIKPYDVPHCHKNGTAKSHRRLHAEIKVRLMKNLSYDIRRKYLHRIFFAVCHNEIECWLMPVFYTDSKACKTHNCIKVLNQALSRKNLKGIAETDKNSPHARDAYKSIFKLMKKREVIERMSDQSYGLKCLLDGLSTITGQ